MKRILAAFLGMVTAFAIFACVPVTAAHPFASATPLKVNQSITDNCIGDVTNYYKVTMPYTGKLYINFEHEWFENAIWDSHEWNIHIHKEVSRGSYEHYVYETVAIDSDETQKFMPIGAQKGDVFYVEISAWPLCEDVDYTLSVSATKTNFYEAEFNDSYGTADKLTLNKKTRANCANDSEDYYYYKMPIDGILSFKFYHDWEKDNTTYNSKHWNVYICKKSKDGSYKTLVYKKVHAEEGTATIKYSKAKKGTKYYVVVSPNVVISNYVYNLEYGIKPTVTLKNKPGKPSVTIKSKKKATIKWSKTSGVTGYQVQICKKSDFKKLTVDKKIKGKSKNKYTKTLSKNKTYYVRVRGYKKVGSKYYYSSWSSKKKFKTKK